MKNYEIPYNPYYYRRRMSPIERYYVSCDTLSYPYKTPCLNQMTIEGTGEFDEWAWQSAVKVASRANPGSRLVLRGSLGLSTWVDSGITTPVRIIDGGDWDGQSDEGAPFLKDPLPAYQGPTSEVLLVKCRHRNYVIFRSHHGVMDGRGTQSFADDVFRVLNGEEPLGENATISDVDLSLKLTRERSEMINDEVAAPTGKPEGDDGERIWVRRTVRGKFSQVLAKVAIGIARSAQQYGKTPVRFQLPVDMRPRVEGMRSTANLSGGIMMHVNPDSTVEQWQTTIKDKLDNLQEAVIPRFMKHIPIRLLCWISLKAMKRANDKLVARRNVSGMYRASGILSNLGLLPIETYKGGGFTGSSAFFIPPDFDTTAFFLTLSGNRQGVELVLRLPKSLANNGRMTGVLDDIMKSLKGETVQNKILDETLSPNLNSIVQPQTSPELSR